MTKRAPQELFGAIARHSLEYFEAVGRAADRDLKDRRTPDIRSIDVRNTATARETFAKLADMRDERLRNLTKLRDEPAIARIVVRDEDDKEATYFVCRGSPLAQPAINYRAPMGRLVSLKIDAEEEIKLPRGVRWFQLRERAILRPQHVQQGWDSINSILEGHSYGPVTIASFIRLLRPEATQEEVEDFVGQLLAAEQADNLVRQGKRRNIIQKMALRDQPILDEFQDAIFRLPVKSRVAVLGPPGSGKTTTLIKRLGLTLDLDSLNDYLDDADRGVIRGTVAGVEEHAQSWLMFTPTELLKQYIKEAFNQENIAAPDSRIKTWRDYSLELGRGELRILRTSTGGGPFVLKPDLQLLDVATVNNQIGWYTDFKAQQLSEFWNGLRQQASILAQDADSQIRDAGQRIESVLGREGAPASVTDLARATASGEVLQPLASAIRSSIELEIRRALSRHAQANSNILDELLNFLDTLEVDDADAEEVEVDDIDDDVIPTRRGREYAFDAYVRAVRALARAAESGRRIRQASRNGRLAAWLGARIPPVEDLRRIGRSLRTEQAARAILNAPRRYVFGIPSRYRQFRRLRQGEGRWYLGAGNSAREIGPLELDAIALAILQASRELQADPTIGRQISPGHFLWPLDSLYRTPDRRRRSYRLFARSDRSHGSLGRSRGQFIFRVRRFQSTNYSLGCAER